MAEGDGVDEAGPMIGWSLNTGLQQRTFDDLVDFPCKFQFKAVGVAAFGFVHDLLSRVSDVLGRQVRADEHSVRQSARGRYKSVTIELVVHDGDEIRDIYAAMGGDSRVKYLL
jgi:putative lipoic acid-binding regulatory protein